MISGDCSDDIDTSSQNAQMACRFHTLNILMRYENPIGVDMIVVVRPATQRGLQGRGAIRA